MPERSLDWLRQAEKDLEKAKLDLEWGQSMNGVKVRFLNRKEILPRLLVLAQGILASRANVMEVSLFGSLA